MTANYLLKNIDQENILDNLFWLIGKVQQHIFEVPLYTAIIYYP